MKQALSCFLIVFIGQAPLSTARYSPATCDIINRAHSQRSPLPEPYKVARCAHKLGSSFVHDIHHPFTPHFRSLPVSKSTCTVLTLHHARAHCEESKHQPSIVTSSETTTPAFSSLWHHHCCESQSRTARKYSNTRRSGGVLPQTETKLPSSLHRASLWASPRPLEGHAILTMTTVNPSLWLRGLPGSNGRAARWPISMKGCARPLYRNSHLIYITL